MKKLASPKAGLVVFILAFAAIGGYIIFHSFAASLTNEGQLIKAFQKLGTSKPSQVQTTVTVNHKAGAAFKSASTTAVTQVDKYGNTGTTGKVTVTRNSAPTSTVIPYEIRNLDNWPYFKLTNTAAIKSVLPVDSNLRNFLEGKPDNYLKRLENNWYGVYPDGKNVDKAPNSQDLGCIVNTPLVPNYDDLKAIANAYKGSPPLTISVSGPSQKKVYVIKPKSTSKDINQFLTNVAKLDYFKGLDTCVGLIAHSSLKDKLNGAISANSTSLTISLDSNKRISSIAFSVDAMNPNTRQISHKVVTATATFKYSGKKTDIVWPDPSGDFNSYYAYLQNPTTGEDNSQFKFNLASGWGSDFCSYFEEQYQSVALYPDGDPTGPYCGYSSSRSYIASGRFAYDYTEDDYFPDDASKQKNSPAKKQHAATAVANKIPQAANQSKVSALANAGSKKKCTEDVIDTTEVTIDGKAMSRDEITYGNCWPQYMTPNSKGIYYYYWQDDPTGPNTGNYGYFEAGYLQKPGQPDKISQFDNMIEAVDIKW